jgi:hypothetical protein
MKSIRCGFAVLALLGLAGFASADDQGDKVKELANRLMQTTRVIAVTNVTSPEAFVPDNDPDTLQIVYIPDWKLGKNHVSDDGQVLWFFGNPTVDDQQPYIFEAFEVRAKRQFGIK